MLPPARWYFDADTIGPGKVLAHGARRDVTWPGDDGERGGSARNWLPTSPIPDTSVKDSIWIPAVTQAGMRIITRDRRIQTRLSEVQAVRSSGAKMFAVQVEKPARTWDLLEALVSRWRDMENLADETPGPFIALVSRTKVRTLDLF